jgi:hypothetical protein
MPNQLKYKGAIYVEAGLNKYAKKLVQKNGGKVMGYDQLPVPAQLAIAHYMVIDADDASPWVSVLDLDPQDSVSDLKKRLPSFLPKLRKNFGQKRFGYVEVPMEEMAAGIMASDPDLKDFPDFAAYHKWYIKHRGTPTHSKKSPWPVILSDNTGELLEDGWHRIHSYYEIGLKKVPAVWYA